MDFKFTTYEQFLIISFQHKAASLYAILRVLQKIANFTFQNWRHGAVVIASA
jgi:hypothetical protein